MQLTRLSLRPAHMNRYRELAMLLARHLRADILGGSGLSAGLGAEFGEGSVDLGSDPEAERARAEELVGELQRMGPTFVKLGQLLSTRGDLLPRSYVESLSALQDDCEPFPFADVEQIVRSELGGRLSRVFVEFDERPVAAASLGQVHRAVLRGGRAVAVKVQRPDIRERMADDLEVLGELTDFIDAHSEQARRYAVSDAFEQFRRALVAELDYLQEAANLKTLREVLADHPLIVVPRAYDDLTTSRVLTMDFVEGRKVKDVGPLTRLDTDLAPLADALFTAYLEQILGAGIFHADPHPANLIVTSQPQLALIDVGMVGRLGVETRKLLAKLLAAVMAGRSDHVARIAKRLGTPTEDFDETAFARSVEELVPAVVSSPVIDTDVGGLMIELARRSADAGLRPAPELAVLGKTLLNLERVAATLNPRFEPIEAMREHVPELVRSQFHTTPGSAVSSLIELKEFVEELPERVNRAVDTIASGRFELRLQAFDETEFLKGLHKLANVAAAGMILAALIIGAALLASRSNQGPAVATSVALAVFALAAALGLGMLAWIAISSRRVRARRRM